MGKIEKIIKKGPVEGQATEVYPVTSTKAVYDENNKRLDNIITGLQESVYLNTPIPISTEDTPEANAQNVKNITNYIEKAKAAGIEDVNGMAVTCIINDAYSGVGYIMGNTDVAILGIKITDDLVNNTAFIIYGGVYFERTVIAVGTSNKVDSDMLNEGARKPIILTPDTTEIDEETYQKLLSDNVDVLFKTSTESTNLCTLTYKIDRGSALKLYFTCFSIEAEYITDFYLYAYEVSITKASPHTCSITENVHNTLDIFLNSAGYINADYLIPILQEIDLTGTDADRKAKLDQFANNWKTLTGASDLSNSGARFMGRYMLPDDGTDITGVLSYDDAGTYVGIFGALGWTPYKVEASTNGSIRITPLFSHLEAVEIFYDDSEKQKNLDNLNAYKNNLDKLGIDTTKGFQVPFTIQNSQWIGSLFYTKDTNKYIGLEFISDENLVYRIEIDGRTGQYSEIGLALDEDVQKLKANKSHNAKAFEAITLKAGNTNSDMAANVATIKAYIGNLNALGVDTTKGFMVSVNVNIPSDSGYYGYMASHYVQGSYFLSGTIFKNSAGENYVKNITINPTGRYDEIVSTTS